MVAASIPNPKRHPARFSGAVVDRLRELLLARYPDPDDRPWLFDCYGGTGERFLEVLGDDFKGSGVELYGEFIVHPKLIKVGDATKLRYYPRRRFVVVTSPVYPHGMAEAWNVSEEDVSYRPTYPVALAALGGTPKPNDMGRLGYRGTKRGGRSAKRAAYWELADATVKCWSLAGDADACEAVFLNVSDFMSGGEVEPFVADWRKLLAEWGWKSKTYKVRTPRHQGVDNADQRVGNECILVAERVAHHKHWLAEHL